MINKYADYLRKSILKAWNNDIYKYRTQKYIRAYIIDVLKKIPEQEFHEFTENLYIKAVKAFFVTNHTWDKSKLIAKMEEEINLSKCKSIENFILRATVPEINKLEQIAVIFNTPVKTYQEFIDTCEEKSVNQLYISQSIHFKKESSSVEKGKKSFLHAKRKLVLFSSVVLIVLIFVFAAFGIDMEQSIAKQQNDSLEYIKEILDQKFEVKALNIKKLAVSQNKLETTRKFSSTNTEVKKVRFETFRIYNDECITSNKAWSFDTDPNGEDMYSKKYGFPYYSSITLLKKSINKTPIANKKMIIRFKIINSGEKSIKISDLTLNIDSVIMANGDNFCYNILKARGTEDECLKIVLNAKQSNYAFYNQIYEIKPDSEAFFIVEIKFPEQECTGNIYKFHFEIAFDDNTTLLSDKKYFLACKNL